MRAQKPQQKLKTAGLVAVIFSLVFQFNLAQGTPTPPGACKDVEPGETCFEVLLEAPFSEIPKGSGAKDEIFTNDKGEEFKYVPGEQGNQGTWYQVIRGKDGGEILENYTRVIYLWLTGAVGIFAVLFLVIGGIQIIVGGTNQESVAEGRKRILAALLGLVLLFLASLILRTINPNFFT